MLRRDARLAAEEALATFAPPERGVVAYSQRWLLASPDGRWLAYGDPASGALTLRSDAGEVRTIAATPGRDARFSDDGREVVTTTPVGDPVEAAQMGRMAVIAVDLEHDARRTLGELRDVRWLEWTRAGVVALSTDARGRDVVTLLPLVPGPPRVLQTLPSLRVTRLAAALDGSRVLYFVDRAVYSLDVARGRRRRLGTTSATVVNAELAPDGRRGAYVTPQGLFTLQGDSPPRRRSREGTIHSLWFSRDGESLAFAWSGGARVLDLDAAARAYDLPLGRVAVRAMRFTRSSAVLLVVVGREVLLWGPRTQLLRPLAAAPREGIVRAADLFAGGVVLWTHAPVRSDRASAFP